MMRKSEVTIVAGVFLIIVGIVLLAASSGSTEFFVFVFPFFFFGNASAPVVMIAILAFTAICLFQLFALRPIVNIEKGSNRKPTWCPHCQVQTPSGYAYCPRCGTKTTGYEFDAYSGDYGE